MFHQLTAIFQIEVQHIEKGGKQTLEVLPVRLISGQGGAEVYLRNVIRALDEIDASHEFVLFVPFRSAQVA